MSLLDDELQVIQAVFCQDGEFVLHDRNESLGSACFTVHVLTNEDSVQSPPTKSNITINFSIDPKYPHCIPCISTTCELLTRKAEDLMHTTLQAFAHSLIGEPMIMQLVEWIQQNAMKYSNQGETFKKSQDQMTDKLTISLLQLDHMRAKNRYLRTLTGWSSELGLKGRVFFVDRLIFILLEGHREIVKEFVFRLRTQKVDVDSSGKSCKERMMSILSEVPSGLKDHRFISFEVAELENLQKLRAEFERVNLLELYDEHIQPIHRHSFQGAVR